jgi:NAD dependent epimerase/dehydratase family enzyme
MSKLTSFISLKNAGRPLRVLLCGAGGYLGRCLEHHLRVRNFDVLPLSRHRSGPVDDVLQIEWGDIIEHGIPRVDFIVNVAGARVFTKDPLTDASMAEIEASRIYTNGILAQAIRKSDYKPRAFVTASCASYYPASATTVYDERYRHPDLDQFGALSLPYFSRLAEAAENASVIIGAGEDATPVIPKHLYKVGRNARGESIYKAEVKRMELAALAAKGDAAAERELQRISAEAMADRASFEKGGLASLDLAGLPVGSNHVYIPKVPSSLSAIEFESHPRSDVDVRVVNVRLGAVMGRTAPVVREITSNPVVAAVGTGTQYTPWVHVDDAMGIFVHAMTNSDCEGPLNAVAPAPATNEEILGGIADACSLPFLPFNVSRNAIVRRYGSIRSELITESTRVYPAKALATGYTFNHTTIESAMKNLDGEYERAWLNQDSSSKDFRSATSNRPL